MEKKGEIVMKVKTEWENQEEFTQAVKELEATLEKANALADALARKIGEINFRIEDQIEP